MTKESIYILARFERLCAAFIKQNQSLYHKYLPVYVIAIYQTGYAIVGFIYMYPMSPSVILGYAALSLNNQTATTRELKTKNL